MPKQSQQSTAISHYQSYSLQLPGVPYKYQYTKTTPLGKKKNPTPFLSA